MRSQELMFLAKLADSVDRMDDCLKWSMDLLKVKADLNTSEKNLLKNSLHKVIGGKMDLRKNLSISQSDSYPNLVEQYRQTIYQEITDQCTNIVELLETVLTGQSTISSENRIFYLSLQGKYRGYLCELASEPDRATMAEQVVAIYREAYDMATKQFDSYDIIVLELAVSLSVFYKNIMNKSVEAIDLAKTAYDNALSKIARASSESYQDSGVLIGVLRDNYTMWSNPDQYEPEPESEPEE